MKDHSKNNKIRIVSMSDTHDLHYEIDINSLPPADIFIHSGDFTKYFTAWQLTRLRQFLTLLPFKYKLVITGNHDFALDKNTYYNKLKNTKHSNIQKQIISQNQIEKLKQICIYLEHQSVEINGINIFGSPYSLQFYDWGFMYNKQQSQQLWSAIPQKTDIIITHGPPLGILDLNYQGKHTGCEYLRKKVFEIKPKLHIFGHIHQSYGRHIQQGIQFQNACLVNISYKLTNKPLLFDLEVKN